MERLFAFEVSNVQTMERPAGAYDVQQQLWVGEGESLAYTSRRMCEAECWRVIAACEDSGGSSVGGPGCFRDGRKSCIICAWN